MFSLCRKIVAPMISSSQEFLVHQLIEQLDFTKKLSIEFMFKVNVHRGLFIISTKVSLRVF